VLGKFNAAEAKNGYCRACERGVLGALPKQRLARLAVFSGVKENVDKNEGSRSFCGFVYDE
jgi:hypothetical protein